MAVAEDGVVKKDGFGFHAGKMLKSRFPGLSPPVPAKESRGNSRNVNATGWALRLVICCHKHPLFCMKQGGFRGYLSANRLMNRYLHAFTTGAMVV